jgi:DNA replication protein DnaC
MSDNGHERPGTKGKIVQEVIDKWLPELPIPPELQSLPEDASELDRLARQQAEFARRKRERDRERLQAEMEARCAPQYHDGDCLKCYNAGVIEGNWLKPETMVWCDCQRGEVERARYERQQAEQEAQRRQRHQKALAQFFGDPGVPSKYHDFTLETLKQRFGYILEGKLEAGRAARKLIECGQVAPSDLGDKSALLCADPDRPRKGLLLYGPVGTGKTGIAVSVFSAMLEKMPADATALFVDVADLLRRKQESYSAGDGDQRDVAAVMAAIRRADLLVLDDFGDADLEDPISTDKRAIMYDVIRDRYNNEVGITIVTTNLEPGQLYKQWGDRIADRLMDMLLPVRVDGANLRHVMGQ